MWNWIKGNWKWLRWAILGTLILIAAIILIAVLKSWLWAVLGIGAVGAGIVAVKKPNIFEVNNILTSIRKANEKIDTNSTLASGRAYAKRKRNSK